jgi:hypothetical protein
MRTPPPTGRPAKRRHSGSMRLTHVFWASARPTLVTPTRQRPRHMVPRQTSHLCWSSHAETKSGREPDTRQPSPSCNPSSTRTSRPGRGQTPFEAIPCVCAMRGLAAESHQARRRPNQPLPAMVEPSSCCTPHTGTSRSTGLEIQGVLTARELEALERITIAMPAAGSPRNC